MKNVREKPKKPKKAAKTEAKKDEPKAKKKAAKKKAGKKATEPRKGWDKGRAFLKRLRDLKNSGGEKLCSITYDEETDSLVLGFSNATKLKLCTLTSNKCAILGTPFLCNYCSRLKVLSNLGMNCDDHLLSRSCSGQYESTGLGVSAKQHQGHNRICHKKKKKNPGKPRYPVPSS